RLLARLTEATEADAALADVVDGAVELTGARRGLVYLRGPGGTFVLSARGRGGAVLDPAEEMASATIVRQAVEGGLVASEDAANSGATFDARARALLARFAQAAALAVAGARERRLLDRVLDAPLDVDELLDAALGLLVELTGAAHGRVLEQLPGDELRVRATRGEGAKTAEVPRALVLEAFKLGASLVV